MDYSMAASLENSFFPLFSNLLKRIVENNPYWYLLNRSNANEISSKKSRIKALRDDVA